MPSKNVLYQTEAQHLATTSLVVFVVLSANKKTWSMFIVPNDEFDSLYNNID